MSKSWLDFPEDSDFSMDNLPLGVFSSSSTGQDCRRCATILGDAVVDLAVLEEAGLFQDVQGLNANVFCQSTLNAFIEHPKSVWLDFRKRLFQLFHEQSADTQLRDDPKLQKAAFHPLSTVTLHLPVQVGDYTDFYSSREHATNVGTMFRGKDHALQPNWLHLPVGYHGRSSTVAVSGSTVRRPCGQLQKDPADATQGSVYGPCRLLDFELEVAAVVGGPAHQQPMTLGQAKDRIFGFLLMNDWSARDIQKFEYVPLGPFTSKNFLTTVSPWIVMTAALEPFTALTSAKEQVDPKPLPYLQDPNYSSYDIGLTVAIQTKDQSAPTVVCKSNFRNLYWNSAQQLAHHSVTGCIMRAGDLLGSGTISGSSPEAYGSMLELSWKGSKEVPVGEGQTRKFLQDGDSVIMKGLCQKEGHGRVGFGECSGTILPALKEEEIIASPPAAEQRGRYHDFVLYSYWRSSSTWRVRIALAAKGIEYATVPVDLTKGEHKTEGYLAKNALGQVPLLEFTDATTGEKMRLAQSLAIISFLDDLFPNRRALIPRDPMEKACVGEMVELINSGTQPLQNVFFVNSLEEQSDGKLKAVELARQANKKGLEAMEVLIKQLRSRKAEDAIGPYATGSFSPTIVDACLVPQMYNARRFGVDVEALCPTLVQIDAICAKHSWFLASHPSVQPDALIETQ